MKRFKNLFSPIVAITCVFLTGCYTEDPGSLQDGEAQFSVVDFDRLDIGDAFKITVTQGEFFSIKAQGDKRNLDDLHVRKDGATLLIDFDDNHNRKHDTYITITMPSLSGINFSGASDSNIKGFYDNTAMDFSLSGASTSQIDMDAAAMEIRISGASHLKFTGATNDLHANVSGASVLSAFDLTVHNAHVYVSGASEAKVTVSSELHASASGASSIVYRGSPTLVSETSGASSIHKD
jgi:hypothetical protein